MLKRAKSVVQLLYKNGAKSVVWGKILNKCGAIEKCGAKWGKSYYIKMWCRQNLLSKLR